MYGVSCALCVCVEGEADALPPQRHELFYQIHVDVIRTSPTGWERLFAMKAVQEVHVIIWMAKRC